MIGFNDNEFRKLEQLEGKYFDNIEYLKREILCLINETKGNVKIEKSKTIHFDDSRECWNIYCDNIGCAYELIIDVEYADTLDDDNVVRVISFC